MDTKEDNDADGPTRSQSGEGDTGGARLVQKRRQYSKLYKRQVVEEALAGEDSVSVIARRHDINTNLLFNWRKQYLAGKYDAADASSLIPITVGPMAELPVTPRDKGSKQTGSGAGRLEIVLFGGHRVLVEGAVDPMVLRTTLEVLTA